MEWLQGGLESFIETAAFLAGSWDLCDDKRFQEHCRTSCEAGQTPDQAAVSFVTSSGAA